MCTEGLRTDTLSGSFGAAHLVFDWSKIHEWYSAFLQTIYSEPYDRGHSRGIKEVIRYFVVPRLNEIKSVLDVGCGRGVAARYFRQLGITWRGITLSRVDIEVCLRRGLDVKQADMHWLPFENATFDLVFARHIAEHSPMPLFALKEWYRVSRKFLLLVVPRVPHFCRTDNGRHHPNHPSAGVSREGWLYLAEEAGWKFVDEQNICWQIEERLFFQK